MKKLLASTALMLALCGPVMAQEYTPDPNAKAGGTITITYKDDVATLDPAIGYDWQNWSMIKSLFDGLMDYVPGTTTLRPGLAESYEISPDGLVPNLLAFNVGVEIGQLLALTVILIGMGHWRRTPSFARNAYTANVAMMSAGFVLVGMQLTGWFVS